MNKVRSSTSPQRQARKTHSKLLRIIPIAAALALMLGITAYAANSFGLRDYFSEIFGGTDRQTFEVLGSMGVDEALSDEELSITSNGTTMTVTSAAYDGRYYYLAIDITAPEGTVLDINSYKLYWHLADFSSDNPDDWLTLTYADGETFEYEVTFIFSDYTRGDNKLTAILQLTSQDNGVFGDGRAKTLRIPGLWQHSDGNDFAQVLSGLWEFDLERIGVKREEG